VGFPLNTRCGGRGICRGCRVELDSETVRACQIPASRFAADSTRLIIPEGSLHDEKLDGVSVFELGLRDIAYHRREGVGLALDIGTTTLAAALWDLREGGCLATGTIANAQRRYGDNVLTRIQYAIDRDGAGATLQSILLRGSLAPLLDQLLANAQLGPESLSECVATGNTVMLHTLAGAALDGFAAYPFKPAFLDAREFRSGDLGLPGDFPIRLAPHFGPFVGADIVAGALASGLTRETGPALLIDFGTNGEILLKTRDGYLATATAAGPAFEGGRLHCGAPAAPGAIGRIARTADGWRTERIGGAAARPLHSLAGSAYVDFMAEALACGLINRMGRFDPAHPAVTHRAIDGERVPVAAITGRVFVSEPDIAELMQAKAAILGGAWTLLEEAGLATGDLQALYVAGGFGYHLDPAHAMAVGLLPSVPRQRIRVIGNASLAGASLLLQANVADDIAALRSACRVLELNQIESFEDHYIDAMALESG
jgi:uncharacterized 2Fe-2S/4Fe-4S cluster protein (DUF4445 family)